MKVDLHTHCHFSWDSKVNPENLVKQAEELGFGAISITDHNDVRSHEIIKELQKKTDVILIPGQEVSTLNGHLLVYGWIPQIPAKLSMKDSVDLAKKHGERLDTKVLCIVPHPYDYMRSGRGSVIFTADIDGFEVLNASTLFEVFNWLARRQAKKRNMINVANSDAHRLSEFGMAYTEIPESTTIDEVLDNLKHGKIRGKKIGIRRKATRFIRRKLGLMTE